MAKYINLCIPTPTTVSFVSDFQSIRTQFIQLLEQIAEERGFKPIHGRILASLFLAPQPRSQQSIAQWTGYSISAISRTLDQLVNLGSVRRFKEPGHRSYLYQIGTSMTSLFVSAIERWLIITERAHEPIASLAESARRLDHSLLNVSEMTEAKLLARQLEQLEKTLSQAMPIFKELLQQLRKLNSDHD